MVGENCDHKVICSSIALLQERFKQLERVKEMREERELLKSRSSASSSDNNIHHPSITTRLYDDERSKSNLLFHSEIIFPTRPAPTHSHQLVSLTLSLWPSSTQIKKQVDDFWDIEINSTRNLTTKPSWLVDVAPPSPVKNVYESSININSDVDTTLHL